MLYNLCFILCAVCIAIAAVMSVWWYATTGDNKYVRVTAKVSVAIIAAVIAALSIICLLYSRMA